MAGELTKAQAAWPGGDMLSGKHPRGNPSQVVYEEEQGLVFPDISPQAPTHFLVIFTKHKFQISATEDENERGFFTTEPPEKPIVRVAVMKFPLQKLFLELSLPL
uniref:HIT domain-containing protein n=1 Tax=Bos indicus x Bos taurus TaxID=30522 RepID=A0A4W2DTS9_BOBOX